MSLNEQQREGYEAIPASAGKVYAHGYGTALQVSENRRQDGMIEAVYDYAAILQADSTQTEGVGSFRALYVGHEQFPQARFRLLQCTVSSDEAGVKTNRYREVGQYIINLPRGQSDYLVKLTRNGDSVDLVASYSTGSELAFHRVFLGESVPITLPTKTVFHPPTPTPPSLPSPERASAEAKELMLKQQSVELLANELLLEAKTRLEIKPIDAKGKEYLLKQFSRLDEELKPVSMVNQPITVRYINQLNQLRALIHDMQTTDPPLFNKTMAREWQAKLGI
jgi:hypothetical protein